MQYLFYLTDFYPSIFFQVSLGTGEGFQGSNPQSCSVYCWVADRGSPLNRGLSGYNTKSLIVGIVVNIFRAVNTAC